MRRLRPVGVAAGAAVLAACAWFATGLRSFSPVAYVPVAIAVVLLALMTWPRVPEDSRREAKLTASPRFGGAVPWIILAMGAVTLEAAALAAGGRSRRFPSLSTVADQALIGHWSRFLLFVAWLGVGFYPAVRRLRRLRRTEIEPT